MFDVEVYDKDTLLVKFHKKMRYISSTVYGGGVGELNYVIFRRVDKEFNNPQPEEYSSSIIKELGLPLDRTAVFLTAVDVVNDYLVLKSEEAPPVETIMTVGLSPLACISDKIKGGPPEGGTINILLAVEDCLAPQAMVELAMLTGSAKTAALSDLGILCDDYSRPYGSVTDALLIASRAEGCMEIKRYAGAATSIGSKAVKMIREGLLIKAMKSLGRDGLLEHLLGRSFDDLVKMALAIYRKAPIPEIGESRVKNIFREELNKALKDPNTWLLLKAASNLTLQASSGTVPGLSKDEYLTDSTKVVADELLGIALSTYINGWRGMFNYYWIDRSKRELRYFRNLPMFIDDIIGALLGGVLSKVYDTLLGGEGN
jgi:alpha-ribazole phosphatase CobZ